jgi:hypothetical protein
MPVRDWWSALQRLPIDPDGLEGDWVDRHVSLGTWEMVGPSPVRGKGPRMGEQLAKATVAAFRPVVGRSEIRASEGLPAVIESSLARASSSVLPLVVDLRQEPKDSLVLLRYL